MGSVRSTAGCLLVTLILFTVGRATDDCLVRHFAMKECIDSANVNFDRLHNSSYKPALCIGVQPMIQCLSEHRGACPNMTWFEGKSGRVINTMLDSYSQVCTRRPGQGAGGEDGCGGNLKRFDRKMARCHRPLTVNLKENQMCGPMKKVIKCMKKQLRRFRACDWMTNTAAKQLQFGANYFNAIRAVKYSC